MSIIKFRKTILSFFLFFLHSLGLAATNATFVYEGETRAETTLVSVAEQQYVPLRDIARSYNLTYRHRPVSREIHLHRLNRKIEFIINSSRYTRSGVIKRMDAPLLLSKDTVLLPVNFIKGQDFSEFTGTETHFLPDTSTFAISRKRNIPRPLYYAKNAGEPPAEVAVAASTEPARVPVSPTEPAVAISTEPESISVPPTEPAVAISTEPESVSVSTDTPRAIEPPQPVIEPTTGQIMPPVVEPTPRKVRIVIDAGHGGEDPGAVGPRGTHEKDINLAVTLKLARLFDDEENIKVLLTRRDDTFIPLVERTHFANENRADIFISIHCNAARRRAASGFEVYFLSEKASDADALESQLRENAVLELELEKKPDKRRTKLQELLWSMIVNEFINESAELAYLVAQEVPKRINVESRGVKQANFFVLRGAQMPAILVECGFISNRAEEKKLRNPRTQRQIADGLYAAIKRYLRTKKLVN